MLPHSCPADWSCDCRHPKKYRVPISPLLAVAWWRVAFDEAQMVRRAALYALPDDLS